YNRWGVLVWESRGYNETNNVFRGYANVGSASGSGNLLPTGTYFYVLSFDANSQPINGQSAYTGYLYLNQ
ncbi:MAG: gliding motility-associated C-terminal domain-containing protein, partial [Bacteroidetes bacterium]|nr:gliding motility-associated C-terminal domain-containing protein [Bacteroidota bacterium]